MTGRIKFYLKGLYGWAELLHYVPFKYEFSKEGPDRVVLGQGIKFYARSGTVATLAVGTFILYWLYEMCFGKLTVFELLTIAGLNCTFAVIHTCQLFILIPSTRKSEMNFINSILEDCFYGNRIPPAAYEVASLLLCCISIVYPIIYFPFLITLSWSLPGVFGSLSAGIEAIALAVSPANLAVAGGIIRACVFGLISFGLGHAVVNCAIFGHWFMTYLFATIERLEDILGRKR